MLDGLPFAGRQFQYVHQRLMVGALPLQRWPDAVMDLRRVTAPGGWVELVEVGTGFHHIGVYTEQFLAWWTAISAKRGIDASKMEQIGQWLEYVGLTHIRKETKTIPVGKWGGRLGSLFAQDVLELFVTLKPHVQELRVEPQTFDLVHASLDTEWNTYHTTFDVYFACGQA